MTKVYVFIGLFGLIGLAAVYLSLGDGAWKRFTTISGIVAIEDKQYNVVCFQDAKAHGISCLPKKALQ